MLTEAVIKAEQVLFPFGKMEIRKREKKKRTPEEENPQERRVAFHRGVHKSWKREQVLGAEEGWQGNRGSNKIEKTRSQSAEWHKGEENGEFHHHALSGHWSCQDLTRTPNPIQTLCAHAEKNSKKPDDVVSLYRLKVMGKGLGVVIHLLLFMDHAGKGRRCDCEGVIRDQANTKWTPVGREDFRKMKCWGCSVPPEAPSEGLNWKGLGNIVVKASERFLRDFPAKECTISFWDGELCWTGK